MQPNAWVETDEGSVGNEVTMENALDCFAHCAKNYQAANFKWVYPNHTGEWAHLAGRCLCKPAGNFPRKNCGNTCSISGPLSCPGFYLGRVIDGKWDDGTKVGQDILDNGTRIEDEFDPSSAATDSHKCTYMEGDTIV